MTTLGTLSNYLENKLINHLLRNTIYTRSSYIYVALYTTSPTDSKPGTEVSIEKGYARQYMGVSYAFNISGNSATNAILIQFPEATENWGTIVGVSIMDAKTDGNILFWGETNNQININTGEIYRINPGALEIKLNGGTKGGWGDGIPELILKHVLQTPSLPFSGTNVYVATGSALAIDENYTFVSWRETTGTGYSRKSATSWYEPTSGFTTNLSNINFATPPIAADWGRITHIVIFNASTTGDALMWGKLYSPIYITAGDGLKFDAGNIDITLN
jgi:hypothetical protein